jgi:hypothetical protein
LVEPSVQVEDDPSQLSEPQHGVEEQSSPWFAHDVLPLVQVWLPGSQLRPSQQL